MNAAHGTMISIIRLLSVAGLKLQSHAHHRMISINVAHGTDSLSGSVHTAISHRNDLDEPLVVAELTFVCGVDEAS